MANQRVHCASNIFCMFRLCYICVHFFSYSVRKHCHRIVPCHRMTGPHCSCSSRGAWMMTVSCPRPQACIWNHCFDLYPCAFVTCCLWHGSVLWQHCGHAVRYVVPVSWMTVCTYWPGINDMNKAYTQSDSMGTTWIWHHMYSLQLTVLQFTGCTVFTKSLVFAEFGTN